MADLKTVVEKPIVEEKPILESAILTPLVKTAIDSKLNVITQVQDMAVMSKTSRYQQVPLTIEKDYKYEVHELISPRGETGYYIIFRKVTDGKEYTKTIGYGHDAKLHTHDWAEYKPDEI